MKKTIALLLAVILGLLSVFTILFTSAEESEKPNTETKPKEEEKTPEPLFSFSCPERPVNVIKIKKSELASYFDSALYTNALSSKNATVLEKQKIKTENQETEANIYILTFEISDFTVPQLSTAEKEANAFLEKYEKDLSEKLQGTYFELISLATRVQPQLFTTEKITPAEKEGEEPKIESTDHLYLHVAFATKQNTDACAKMISEKIAEAVKPWSALNFSSKIQALNKYLLTEMKRGNAAESTCNFIEVKQGNSIDFTGAAYLFIQQMGYHSIVVHGTYQNKPTTWLLVKNKDGNYYHLDIYNNLKTVAEKEELTEDYLLIGTTRIKQDHTIDSSRNDAIIKKASADFDFMGTGGATRNTLKTLIESMTSVLNQRTVYTEQSFTVFENTLTDTKAVYNNSKATPDEIQAAYTLLKSAYNELIKISSDALDALKVLLDQNFNPEFYDENSYRAYEKAVAKGTAVYLNDESTQEQINQAANAISTAADQLVVTLSDDILNNYIASIEEQLYSLTAQISDDLENRLSEAKNQFLALYDTNHVSAKELAAATANYNHLMQEIDEETNKRQAEKDSQSNAILKEKIEIPETSTELRSFFVFISGILAILAIISFLLYLFPPQFLQ